jgi:ribosomal-protein-serine acetyltransferase
MDKIIVNNNISLELLQASHAASLFSLIDSNRQYLRQHLGFLDNMLHVEDVQNFINGCKNRNALGIEYAYLVFADNEPIGRVGLYKIDATNKTSEIGYWLAENEQGKGIITKSCSAIINFAFNVLALQRIELRCGINNLQSMAIANKLGFTKEGTLLQAENLYGNFIDLHLFSLLLNDKK